MSNSLINSINNNVSFLCTLTIDDLITEKLTKKTDILRYKEHLIALFSDFKIIHELDLNNVVFVEVTFKTYYNRIHKLRDIIEQLKNLSSDGIDIDREYKRIAGEILLEFDEYIKIRPQFMELISISTGNRFNAFIGVMQEGESNIQDQVKSFKTISDSERSTIASARAQVVLEAEKATEKLEQTVNDQKTLTEVKLLSKYGDFFGKKGAEFNEQATKSLVASISIGAVILGISLAMFFLFDIDKVERFGGQTAFIAAKLAIYAVLFIFLNFTIKSYKTAKHNAVVYENKHLALKTFEIFAGHTQDEKTRDIVLITANNLIYSDINTGYLNNDSNSSYHDNVLEMIKNFNKK